MNSKKHSNGSEISKDCTFLGRSGVKIIKGMRIAFLSGIDFDVIGGDVVKNDSRYIGNYFRREDINKLLKDYKEIIENDTQKREGVDIFISC